MSSGRVSEVTQHPVHAEQTKGPFFFQAEALTPLATGVKPGVSEEIKLDICSIQT